MAKYHINPKTGNPGICKAKIKCRFGDMETEHYSSRETAREAYEEKMKYSSMKYNDLIFEHSKIHTRIIQLMSDNENMDNYDVKIKPFVEKRTKIENTLKNYQFTNDPVKISGDRLSEPHRVDLPAFRNEDGKIIGIHNDLNKFNSNYSSLSKQISSLSKEWSRRLNDRELNELYSYAIDSKDYAKNYNSNSDKNDRLNRIIDQAPPINEIKVYSGLSFKTLKSVMRQIESGKNTITIDRAISTSINPAQVNEFMVEDKTDYHGSVVLCIETNRGAFMQNFSNHPE